MSWKRRGGRKVIIARDGGDAWVPTKPRPDETLIARWRGRIGGSGCSTTANIDPLKQRGVTRSYVNRLLRLTLLAPDIQEAILDGRQPKGLQLAMLTGALPSAWEEQRQLLPTTFACAQQAQQMQGDKGTARGLSQWIPQQWF
jgi:hypothetical protein